MTHLKSVVMDHPLTKVVWGRAHEALAQADDIYFIGYSFPQTDINAVYFFKQFGKKIRGICIGPQKSAQDKDVFINRINGFFAGDLSSIVSIEDGMKYLEKGSFFD
jgi:hypothetical protein